MPTTLQKVITLGLLKSTMDKSMKVNYLSLIIRLLIIMALINVVVVLLLTMTKQVPTSVLSMHQLVVQKVFNAIIPIALKMEDLSLEVTSIAEVSTLHFVLEQIVGNCI